MRTGKLNVKQVEAILAGRGIKGKKPCSWYGDGGGLGLVIKKRDPRGRPQAASWVYSYMIHGARHETGLGSVWTVSLAEAREEALELRKRTSGKDRVDVLAEKLAKAKKRRDEDAVVRAQAMTFKACAEAYMRAHQEAWRNPKHRAQWHSTLETFVYPAFADVPVAEVDTGMIVKVLEPIWSTKTETASRIRGRIESVLDWATAGTFRSGDNPARWDGNLKHLLPARDKITQVRHHAAIAYAEIGDFVRELRDQEGTAAHALEFTILTASRTGETLGAKWSEINRPERMWTVPGARMKGGKEWRCPLSGRALEILDAMEEIQLMRPSEFVFQGQKDGRPLSNMALLMLMRRMGRDELTTHGFRSSFRDWCAAQTSFAREVAEMALAHVVGSKVEQAYLRGDLFQKRRQLAEAWARYCAKPVQNDSGKVVAIGGS